MAHDKHKKSQNNHSLSDIYPAMTYDEKMQIVATQIDILNSYDPEGKISRLQKACEVSCPNMCDDHLPSHDEIDSLIYIYNENIKDYKKSHEPEHILITKSRDTQDKFSELENRLNTTACPTL
ncbi:hypothetical protein GF378_02450 [Candidatus Pacearchaeota archaeon]|nr:hypothetical protein [Candidatus Pacearchaeota archaeon]